MFLLASWLVSLSFAGRKEDVISVYWSGNIFNQPRKPDDLILMKQDLTQADTHK